MSSKDPTWISDWNPEDPTFWETKGKVTARRNLIWSIVAEHIGFSVWLIWSIVATKLPAAGFHYTTDQLFQLVHAHLLAIRRAVLLVAAEHRLWQVHRG